MIVQDLTAVRLAIREIAPGDETPRQQRNMSIYRHARGVELARTLRRRPRHPSPRTLLEEIRTIAKPKPSATLKSSSTARPLRSLLRPMLFVRKRGEARSANRGQRAQACRLPYELLVDGSIGAPSRRALPALARRPLRPPPNS